MSEVAAPTEGGQGAAAPASSASVLNSAAPAASAPAQPTSQQVVPPAPAQPANQAIEWLKDADELTVGYTANKGWKDPSEVVRSYQNLEKLLGADKANNAIVIPKPDADAKEWAQVYDRLGRPTDPSGYKVAVPEGGNAEFQTKMLGVAHELGLTKTQAEKLFTTFNEQSVGMAQAQAQAKVQQFQADDVAVKTEWGQAYTKNLAEAQSAARFLGLDGSTIDKLSDALGHKATMQMLQRIGSRATESSFVDGGSDKPGFSDVMTPAQAKAEIKSLSEDKGFVDKLRNKDAAANQRWTQLHQWAFPE